MFVGDSSIQPTTSDQSLEIYLVNHVTQSGLIQALSMVDHDESRIT